MYEKRYNPNRSAEWNYGGEKWKLSRSKIDFFIECPRCFYIDNKLGTKRPSIPTFTLNVAVDTLLKKEFDGYRKNQTPHPLMETNGVDAVPFQHKDLEVWRDPFQGITYTDPTTGFVISGAVDDLWVTPTGELLIVDYKATAKEGSITTLADSAWEEQYKRQVGVYQWLFRKNGYTVSPTAYFVYANGQSGADGFFDTLTFETTLIPCVGDDSWVDTILPQIHACLLRDVYPASAQNCEYCAYREACGKKLQKIHHEKST